LRLFRTVGQESVYHILFDIDEKYELEAMEAGCPHCGAALHRGSYPRKPRGGPKELPEKYMVRLSLCCSQEGCRKRLLPKSVLFDGRHVYLRAIILVVVALREQRESGFTMSRLASEFGVDAKTVKRWQAEYRERFSHGRWCGFRRRFAGGLVSGAELSTIILFFVKENDSETGVVRLLRFLVEYEHPGPWS